MGASSEAAAGNSSEAPVANAAALAAWPEGKDVLEGWVRSRLIAGTRRSEGRRRRKNGFRTRFTSAAVSPTDSIPRCAALRPDLPPASASSAEHAIQRREWLAACERAGSARSSSGER